MATARNIIVIGASLGGLDALCKLTGSFPATLRAALMIVLHTSSRSPRLLADIIGRCTPLRASYANDGDEIRPGTIYFAPPDQHLIVTFPGRLGLKDGPKVRHSRPAADVLFQSAAEVFGSRVIGVVLTGGDHDGTDGLRAIKACGGVSVVQSPTEARDPSMPVSALKGDSPDYCVPLDMMGSLLIALVKG